MIKEDLLKHVVMEQQMFLESGEDIWHREYEKDIVSCLDNDFIIFLTGVRRAGKSYLLKIAKNIAAQQKNIPVNNFLYINFEDERLVTIEPHELSSIIELYFRLLKPDFDKKIFLLLDEIQHIPQWDRWINRLFEQKRYKIFITGSNASLLKEETGKLLTGRSLSIDIFPLSFKEYFHHFKKAPPVEESDLYDLQRRAAIINGFEEYSRAGGFPEQLKFTDYSNHQILQEYFKDIIQKDIIYRYSIRYKKELKEMAKIVISGPGNILSFKNIAAAVGLKNISTVKNYIEYLQESYLLFRIPFFSPSVKKQIYNPNKFYGIDPGLYHSVSFRLTENPGPLIENIVFLELRRRLRGLEELFYYKTRTGKEIDFLLNERGKITLIQVCYDLANDKTFKREIGAVIEAAKEIGITEGIILNGNMKEQIQEEGITVSILPVWEYLLT
jgi:uncharacterized protein